MKQMYSVGRMQSFQCEIWQYIGQLLSVNGSVSPTFDECYELQFTYVVQQDTQLLL